MSQPTIRTTWPYASFSKNFIPSALGSEFDNMFSMDFFFSSSHQTILERKNRGKTLIIPICILGYGQVELLAVSLNTHSGSRSPHMWAQILLSLCLSESHPFFFFFFFFSNPTQRSLSLCGLLSSPQSKIILLPLTLLLCLFEAPFL